MNIKTTKKLSLNLPSLSLSLRALFSSYLLVVAIGLMMSGFQILLTHGMADGKFGLSINDIVYSYYGNRGGSILEGKLHGSMKDKASVTDKASIIKWIQHGSTRVEWDNKVEKIFQNNCIKCHGTIPGLASFTSFSFVKNYTKIDKGASIDSLTRVSHIHLFGIAFIFFFVCIIFSLAIRIPFWLKVSAISFPFLFLIVDIFSWWLIKWYPNFAILTIIGGFGYNLAAGYMIITSFVQMWIWPRYNKDFDENAWLD
ncbi:hypothetical protein OAB57_00155 [Bacteriovoracaceae bacterium]|nr:hypothetical protein [Bacteriovoracaceae bacterium]